MKLRSTISFAVLSTLLSAPAFAQIAVRAKTLYTMAGAPITDGVVVVRDGKIAAVGPAASTVIPDGFRVLDAAVATPGLIDARCTVGVSGILNQEQDQDQLERSGPIQPELRAIDAYNPQDPLVEYVRSYGVTTIQTGHAPGQVVSGQLAIVKTFGNTVDGAVVVAESAIAVTLSPMAQRSGGGGGAAPGTRAKMIALIRDQFLKAQAYQKKLTDVAESKDEAKDATKVESKDAPATEGDKKDTKKKEPPARDLRLEALVRVLEGKTPLVVTANRSQDIANVLRFAEEFDIRVILDSASEAYLIADQIKAANRAKGFDVLVHPTMARAVGEMENKTFENAAKLREAGLRVAIQGGFESYVPKARVVLFEAGVAAANGLGLEGALAAITIDAAKILGIDARVGSLEVGKDADIALYSGDPFEYTTTCTGVIIDGAVVVERGR
jgi:imidazolonepropionase-like amidohydrolase